MKKRKRGIMESIFWEVRKMLFCVLACICGIYACYVMEIDVRISKKHKIEVDKKFFEKAIGFGAKTYKLVKNVL